MPSTACTVYSGQPFPADGVGGGRQIPDGIQQRAVQIKITVRYMYDAFLSYSAAFHAVSRAISIISWKESCRS